MVSSESANDTIKLITCLIVLYFNILIFSNGHTFIVLVNGLLLTF